VDIRHNGVTHAITISIFVWDEKEGSEKYWFEGQ
jgi:hypothetical protein